MMSQTVRAMFLLFVILLLGTVAQIFAAAGDLDFSFGGEGILTADYGFESESVVDLAIQPDGKIIAVGFSQGGPNPVRRILIVRYNTNGSIDTTFGTGGKVSIQQREPGQLALQPDGKIVFISPAGTSPFSNFYVGRLNPDGSFDTTFNGTGTVNMNLRGTDDSARSVKIQPDGKIVVGGTSSIALSSSQGEYAIVRFNANGSLDTTFDGDGKVFTTVAPPGQYGDFADLAVQSDGKIVIAGNLSIYLGANLDYLDFLVVRYNANGTLDTTFDGDGIVSTRFEPPPPATRAWVSTSAVALQTDGKIVVVGSGFVRPPPDFALAAVARYNPDGSLDSSFINGGKVLHAFPPYTQSNGFDVAIQADNKIVIAGDASNSSNERNPTVARLNTDGSLDTGFSGDGANVVVGPPNRHSPAFAVAIQPNGKIVTGGYNGWSPGSDFMLMRFESSTCTVNCVPRREVIADFDGDGKTDLSVFRNGTWFINRSSDNNPHSYYTQQIISPPEYLTPADYDGDGRTDVAIWLNSSSSTARDFYIIRSATNTFRYVQFGREGDDPRVVGDWDGDGRADPAVYRGGASAGAQGTFYYLPSSQPTVGFVAINWGTFGDEAVRGDFDGDGRFDPAVFRPSDGVWYILQSSNSQPRYVRWGLATDKRVPGDFDGDGKTDCAIYRDGLWAVIESSNNQARYVNWGLSTDRVVAGDYDGDGKTDPAVYRDGVWYLLRSQQGFGGAYFGLAGDRPIPNVFVP